MQRCVRVVAGFVLGLGLSVGADTTKSFQQGVNGYTGTRDTYTNGGSVEANYGGSVEIAASTTTGHRGLLAFDGVFGTGPDQVPANRQIVSATLTLTRTYLLTTAATPKLTIALMQTDWVEGTLGGSPEAGSSCYSARYYGVAGAGWGSAGTGVAGPLKNEDFSTTVVASYTLPLTGGTADTSAVTFPVDVTGLLRALQQNPSGIYGFELHTNSTSNSVRFASSEYSNDASLRPKLEVTYLPDVLVSSRIAEFNMESHIDNATATALFDVSWSNHNATSNRLLEYVDDDPFNLPYSRSVYMRTNSTYVFLDNATGIDLSSTGQFTIEAWVKPLLAPGAGSYFVYLYSTTGGTSLFRICMDANGMPYGQFNTKSNGTVTLTGPAALPVNEWSHVAMTYGFFSPQLRLYVNGTLVASSSDSKLMFALPTTLNLGCFELNGATEYLIDDVRISRVALGPAQLGYTVGSLTPASIDVAEELGFDAADSTEYVQRGIDSGAGTVVIKHMPSDWIVRPLFARKNVQTLQFQDGPTVLAKRGEFLDSTDSLFRVTGDNVTLTGTGSGTATLKMWKNDYQSPPYDPSSPFHMGVRADGTNGLTLSNLTIRETGGDGIYLSAVTCADTTIRSVTCDNNTRQGMTIIGATNLLIENSVFMNTAGASPRAGIDIEPNDPDNGSLDNITIRGCIFAKNQGAGLNLSVHPPLNQSASITVENCTMYDNSLNGLRSRWDMPSCIFKDCILAENNQYGCFQDTDELEPSTNPIQLSYSALWNNASGAFGGFAVRGSGCVTDAQPIFVSTNPDDAYYLYLNPSTPASIKAGDSSGSYMGARPVSGNPATYNLTGTVTLQSYGPGPSGVPITVQLKQGGSVVRTDNVTLTGMGQFTLTNVAAGTYDMRVKAARWLAKTMVGIVVNGNTDAGTFTLVNGDVNNDNAVTGADLSAVLTGLDTAGSADLDGDGDVTSTDLAIVLESLDQAGQ